MPDDRILVTASDASGLLSNGPMAGHLAAIVDVATATFQLLPTATARASWPSRRPAAGASGAPSPSTT
jgi:hypothetical protein